MTRTVLLALFAAVPAVAAPIPEAEAERLAAQQVFGRWEDPTGRCDFSYDGERVRVRLPAQVHAPLEHIFGIPSAPGFFRTVTGDFTAVVRIDVSPGLNLPANRTVYVAGGLVATGEADYRVGTRRLDRSYGDDIRAGFGHFYRTILDGGGVGGGNSESVAGGKFGPGFVRLSRGKRQVTLDTSWDGKDWQRQGEYQMPWGRPVRLGLVAENTLPAAAWVTFDRFSLTQPKKGPEATP